ncbi:MAG TPA: tetratricopeptide repeat protein [Tepidisphaeraceae bacterium]|jgi:predicted O-linked N-acetylglucosamine transferase (SPINDLY family)|nr:tetratricopeptide repeat protein [Tepidisphaeraceae bacterium]
MTIEQAMGAGMEHHRAGRLAEAEGIYRQVLGVVPGYPEALHYLGVIAHQVGKNEAAEGLIREAIAKNPGNAAYWNNLGQVLRALGKPGEAVEVYRRAGELGPGEFGCRENLTIALRECGRSAEAVEAARKLVSMDENRAGSYLQLAAGLMGVGDDAGAVAATEKGIRLGAGGGGFEMLGVIHLQAGKLAEAEGALRRGAELMPGSETMWNHLGIVLMQQGKRVEGAVAFQRIIGINPRNVEARVNLGNALLEMGRAEDAVKVLQGAVELARTTNALIALGAALSASGRLEEAVTAWRGVVEREPGNVSANNNIAAALATMGLVEEGQQYYQEALKTGGPEVYSNMLLDMHYVEGISAGEMLAAHLEYGRRWGKVVSSQEPVVRRGNGGRIRVGYYSPDFRAHSVADFIAPLIAGHDREEFEVVCYANVHGEDVYTERLKRQADLWRDVSRMSDEEAAGLIRSDGVDILVDLAGHTARGRLGIFARRGAPVQISYLGYPDTTGISQMDYRLTDGLADPVGSTEGSYVERLVRLPRTAWCYQAWEGTPGVGESPAERNGYVTFGSFNNLAKVTPGVIGLWARVLKEVPGSRMLVKAGGLNSAAARERVLTEFEKHGVERERVEVVGRIEDLTGHLGAYGRVDVGLDTFPYHGATTTCEAMYMGVPVVTLAGQRHVSRVGVSLLTNVGMGELVAKNHEEYVRIAAKMVGDIEQLKDIRRTLRGRMESSPLMDARGFVRDVEEAYGRVWAGELF